MFPLIATPSQRILVVGQGPMAKRRVQQLQEGGMDVQVETVVPSADIVSQADVLFVIDMPEDETQTLVELARKHKVWVNVHDQPALCDFHVPSIIQQGDLLVSVSTGGKAPGLAKRIRHYLENILGQGWDARITQLNQVRQEWKKENVPYAQMVKRMDAIIDKEGWL